jgi:hypothetical protein
VRARTFNKGVIYLKDRVSTKPGRVLIKPESGAEYYAVLTRADEPSQEGTPLNKATFLTDAVAALLGLTTGDPTPNAAFSALYALITQEPELNPLAEFAYRQAKSGSTGLNEVLASTALLDIMFSTASVVAEIVGDTEFITALAASDTAMQKIAANASVMAALAQNSAAMTIFMASNVACTRLGASATAMAAIAAYSAAMNALYAAPSANKAKYANSTAWSYLQNSSYKKSVTAAASTSAAAIICLSNAMVLGYSYAVGASQSFTTTVTSSMTTGTAPPAQTFVNQGSSSLCGNVSWSTYNLASFYTVTAPILTSTSQLRSIGVTYI